MAELIPFQPEPEKGKGSDALPVDLTYEEQIVLDLCREGKGRNEIASLTGISTWTVSQIASRHGHYFGRTEQLAAAQAARDAQLRERKQRLALQLLDNAELYADALSGVGTPKDGQLVAKALRDILESHELLAGGVAEGESVEEAKDWMVGLRNDMALARAQFEQEHGVPLDSPEAREILNKMRYQEESSDEQP
ncbi:MULTISPECIES: hypothetical protein [Streptomyces]|uniref:hypothetical protein n=1 Tax=Streptomyces TaxID=1883 RepID=UPI0011515374|nr:hypothetical protein [Streptomyces calvus]